MTIELDLCQFEYAGELITGGEIDPSTNPSLFLADKERIIDRFQDWNPIPLKTVETRMEFRLSEDPM